MKNDVRETDHSRADSGAASGVGLTARLGLLLASVMLCAQPSCVFVGGYSSEGGWYVWPGSLLLTAAALAVFFLLARRRR